MAFRRFIYQWAACCLSLASLASTGFAQGTLQVTDGLVGHFDASRGVVNSVGKVPDATTRVARWSDLATAQGDNVAVPPTFYIGPFLIRSVPELNGRSALDFRNDALLGSSVSISETQVSWFVVFRSDFSAEDQVMQFSTQTSTFVSPDSGGKVVARGWRNTSGSFPIDAPIVNLAARKQEFFIQSAWRMNADVIAQRLIDRQKQVLSASNTGANAARTSTLVIGGVRPNGGPSSGLFNGQIAEILVYNRSLTSTERTSVEDYLHYKYFGPADSDGDSLPDEWEMANFGALGEAPDGDSDGDLLTNRKEFEAGSNPKVKDSDGDGLDDAREIAASTAPGNADSDNDQASDPIELLAGTNPTSASSVPAARFQALKLHSDMESGDAAGFMVRNLAGPGDGTGTHGAPEFRAAGIAGEGIRLGGTAGIDFGVRPEAAVGPFTVSLAFRPDAIGQLQFLASQGNRDLTRPGWSIFLDGNALVLRVMNEARSRAATFRHAGPFVAGAWRQVAFSYDAGGNIIPYLDGSSAGWSPGGLVPGGLSGGPGATLLLGMSDAQASGFTGIMDEFSLWSRVLTGPEIAAIHTSAAGGVGLDGKSRNAAPNFSAEPKPSVVFTGQSFELSAQASGATLQWQKNGGNLSGQSGGALLVTPSVISDAGRYRVMANFPTSIRPSPEALVRVADLTAAQVFKTRGGATNENGFLVRALDIDGDGLAAGMPTHVPPSGFQRGRVYFFRRSASNPDSWNVAQTVDAPSGFMLNFGTSVALQGNTMVVGASYTNAGSNRFGRAYVYRRTSTTANWVLQQEILSPVQDDNDRFGSAIALDGDTLVISAPGVMKAFVFGFNGTNWVLAKTLAPAGTPARTLVYGDSLALQGDTLVIGDMRSGIAADNSQGVVYLHRRNTGGSGQWGMTQKLKAPVPSASDEFGLAVALDGDVLAVSKTEIRSVEIYSLNVTTGQATWRASLPRPVAPGVSPESDFQSSFGLRLTVKGDYLLTGNGADNEFGPGAGAAFLFRRDPGSLTRWTLIKKLAGDDIGDGTGFGIVSVMQNNEIFATGGETSASNVGTLYGFRVLHDIVPEVTVAPRTLADTGKEYRHEILCRVPPGVVPVITAGTALPPWLTLQATGPGRALLSGTPPPGAEGNYPIRLQVGGSFAMGAGQEFMLHVLPGNLAPWVMKPRVEMTAAEDSLPLQLDLREIFIDGEDGFSLLALNLPGTPPATLFGASIGDGMLTIAPVADANGVAEVKVSATDRGGLVSEATVSVTLLAVNDSPRAEALPQIDADAAANPVSRELAGFFSDVDLSREGDRLVFSIEANSAPELFSIVTLDPSSGRLDLAFAPYRSGTADLTIRATDKAGLHAESVLKVVVPELPPPVVQLQATKALNRQTGLFEQSVTFTNSGQRAIGGFDLAITGLPDGVTVNNASAVAGNVATISMRRPLGIGESVTILIEYMVSGRSKVFTPLLSVSVTLPENAATATGDALAVDRCLYLEEGAFLIEFTSEPGKRYEIQYSNNHKEWIVSPVIIRAGGNRVQWIDRGPPRTESPPVGGSRFYRVKLAEEES